MILDQAWALSPSVALRHETFGALAYHFGNRKLTFLKRPELLTVVRVARRAPRRQVGAGRERRPRSSQHAAYAKALAGLASVDVIRPRPDARPDSREDT